MNTNDNTEPCPTCSMAVNKSAIKLAARVAELEAALRGLVQYTDDTFAGDGMDDSHEQAIARRALVPGDSVSEDPKIIRNMSTPETRAFWESAERSAEDVATWPDWKRAGINVSAQRIEPRTSEAMCGAIDTAWPDTPPCTEPKGHGGSAHKSSKEVAPGCSYHYAWPREPRPSETACKVCEEEQATICTSCHKQGLEEAVDHYSDAKGYLHCQGCIRGEGKKCPGTPRSETALVQALQRILRESSDGEAMAIAANALGVTLDRTEG